MGRRYEYFCDSCGKEFNQLDHINCKVLHVYHSMVTHYESNNPKNTKWSQHPVLNGSDEKHFCNGKCLGDFITKLTPKETSFGGNNTHIFINGVCKNCGVSQKANDFFKWKCNKD